MLPSPDRTDYRVHMTNSRAPRVAICGISLESNAFSPPAGEADFQSLCLLEGAALLTDARSAAPKVAAQISGFVAGMDVTGPWTPVPSPA